MASHSQQEPQPRPSRTEGRSTSSTTDDHTGPVAAKRSEDEAEGSRLSTTIEIPEKKTFDAAPATDATTQIPTRDEEPRHCWICLQDEDEETSENSVWRSPCPCNLRAHEDCMLDWIANLEIEELGEGKSEDKILCPQCKAEIHVEAPRDIFLSITKLLNKIAGLLLIPTTCSVAVGCLYTCSFAYGMNIFRLVFGSHHAELLIRQEIDSFQVVRNLIGDRAYRGFFKLTAFTDPFIPLSTPLSLRLFLGLPMIAPALILSRFDHFDRWFTALPIPLLAFNIFSGPSDHRVHWPPSPSLAFAFLPVIRTAYKTFYKSTLLALEKKLDQAMMRNPREGETIEQVAQQQNAPDAVGGMPRLEIRADIDIGMDIGVDEEQEALAAEARAVADNEDRVAVEVARDEAERDEDADANANNNVNAGQQDRQRPAAQQQNNNDQPINFNVDILKLTQSVIGALYFPAISTLMGDLLEHTLPKTWVTRPSVRQIFTTKQLPATGLLQEKWGRSLAGGLLFVVLKDAMILYVKWARARNHAKRKILDYVRT